MSERLRRIFGLRPRFLARGESAVAWAGLAFGGLVLAMVAALAWWSDVQRRDAERLAARREASIVLDAAGSAAARLLAHDEVSSVRALASEVARNPRIESVAVTLGDGRVLAHSDPSRIDVPAGRLPDRLPPIASESAETELSTTRTVRLDGRGGVRLRVEPAPAPRAAMSWDLLGGVGAITVGGLLILLALYRRLRTRLRSLGAVRDALVDMAHGEADVQALLTDDALGPVARAWNDLLRDRERLRTRVQRDHIASAMAARQGSGGELKSACDALWLGLVVVDERPRVTYANGAAAVFLQTERDRLIGSTLTGITDDPEIGQTLARIAKGEACQRRTIEIERAEPTAVTLRVSIRALRREDAGSALVAIEDVTQQRVAAEARSQFVAQATHELRTPLTNIRLYVEEALDLDESALTERSRCLNVINQETRRLERVVSDMLSVSEIEAGALTLNAGDVRLDQLFEDFREDYQAQARAKGVSLSFELPPKLPVARGDREKLAVALHNLVGNAIKYTPEGGSVSVRVEADETRLSVAVADTGYGIPEEDQERIFQRFVRVQEERVQAQSGTGIGLALAREIARLHGGEITLESTPDQGSTFTLEIPIARATAQAA